MMTSADASASSSQSSSAAPSWTNTAVPNRAAPIEDHHGTTTTASSSSGMDELLAPVCTLDETVMETIMGDVRAVGAKLKAVLIPLDRNVSAWCTCTMLLHYIVLSVHTRLWWWCQWCTMVDVGAVCIQLHQNAQLLFPHHDYVLTLSKKLSPITPQNKKPFGYVGVLQEEDVEPSDGQRNVLNQLRDWDLWCVFQMNHSDFHLLSWQ